MESNIHENQQGHAEWRSQPTGWAFLSLQERACELRETSVVPSIYGVFHTKIAGTVDPAGLRILRKVVAPADPSFPSEKTYSTSIYFYDYISTICMAYISLQHSDIFD